MGGGGEANHIAKLDITQLDCNHKSGLLSQVKKIDDEGFLERFWKISGMELPWYEWSGHNNIISSDLFDIFGQENEYI